MQIQIQKRFKQNGAALILITFIIALAAIYIALHSLTPEKLKAEQNKKTYFALNEAKKALISWSISHPSHPGQMPFPDRGTGGGYDGKSDCNPPNNNPLQYSFLIGQLPIYGQTNPCADLTTGVGGDFQDASGNRLWYAVSRNLIRKYETDPLNTNPINPIINPNVIDNPIYPWLKVLDRNGVLISDRIAAVIIAPGDPIIGQNRTLISPASEFLDTFKIGANTYSNADYTKPDEDFVIGEDSRNVSDLDVTFVKPYYFNDKLVYITIDELMDALNSRAAAEASNLLSQYKNKTGQYPYATDLGVTLNNNIFVPLSQKGMLPIDVTDTCSCTTFQSCTCSFKPIVSVTFTKNSGTWLNQSPGCTRSGNKCTCSAAGSCSRSGISFTCTSAGKCTTNQTGVNLFTYTIPSYADAIPDNAGCFVSGSNPACNSAGTFSIGLKEAAWFKDNLWQDYFYYEWSPLATLQVGVKTGVNALLIGTGENIIVSPYAFKGAAQNRPSNLITDYLDSAENTDGNNIFDATNKQKTNNYNDQTFIVAP
jgi:hypothetical protein